MRDWGLEETFMDAIFREYWELDNGGISEYSELKKIANRLGVDPATFESRSESEHIRNALIESTNAARMKGVFGAPSLIIDKELYWGKDRMDFVEDHLKELTS